MKKLSFLILFLFICSFCNAQEGYNFTVKEIDSIIKINDVITKGGLAKIVDGREVSGVSYSSYYIFESKEKNERIIKGTYHQNFLFEKYSEESNMELYFNKGELFFAKLEIKKYNKRFKEIESNYYKYSVGQESTSSDILPDNIKEWIEDNSQEILEKYNSAKYEN
ncbi:hypothetical protein GCM10007424_05400 [Flavobacterium suaedae]|uniref:DUF4468 domain-containing protein n=1 Tax=Flavobacterium suaedae TaxID=1767027 RepID=A0ABQ1JGC7_9FLAO|nr:hypothetical protein [Flavobacterium suaedae]GGB68298.1 hypothetical protein GCM10007424_05400 [Flavobacterium suaedae]